MNLEEKQMLRKNAFARRCGTFLALTSMLFAILSLFGNASAGGIVRIILSIVLITVIEATYPKLGSKETYRFFVTISMALLYLTTLFLSTSNQIFALMFSIIIIVLIYGHISTVVVGIIVAMFGLIVADLIRISNGILESSEFITQLIFAFIACYLTVRYCSLNRSLIAESNDAIRTGAEAQAQTADNIICLAEQLTEKFQEASIAKDSLNKAMESTHNSVNEIVKGTKNTAISIEDQTAQTSDIQKNIENVGDEATTIKEITQNVESSIKEGVLLINQLKSQAVEVANINLEASTTTKALNDSIQDVQAITETILGISSQTNLLALNASIEAARAGEAGKGFAVVADEIRALSESTREATEQIAAIIERLTGDAISASSSMNKSAEYAQKQQELIEETGTKLTDIKEQTEILYNGVTEVHNNVNTVLTANTQIMDSISNLSSLSEEVSVSADNVLLMADDSMNALEGMNSSLNEIASIAKQMEEVAKS